jgi:hypothetical protein
MGLAIGLMSVVHTVRLFIDAVGKYYVGIWVEFACWLKDMLGIGVSYLWSYCALGS